MLDMISMPTIIPAVLLTGIISPLICNCRLPTAIEADGLPWGPVSAKAARLFEDVWKALYRISQGEALHIHAQYSILAKAHADFVESPYTEPFTNA
ncbi:hypothetical protein M514_18164 [Trichuris suis]|uniref:Uncharacterized protein n=1 Tax=Trichuris suis TaxID=68888 RepID=A0A085NJY3_9BILA|nr:hypothetical protein M514_18164 [Trichuris suis]